MLERFFLVGLVDELSEEAKDLADVGDLESNVVRVTNTDGSDLHIAAFCIAIMRDQKCNQDITYVLGNMSIVTSSSNLTSQLKLNPYQGHTVQQSVATLPFPSHLAFPRLAPSTPSFVITCNQTSLSSYTPLLLQKDNFSLSVHVLDISLDGELNISLPVAKDCINQRIDEPFIWSLDLTPFHLSSARNKLTVVGADTAGVVRPFLNTEGYPSTCVSLNDTREPIYNESCSGTFCCETPIQQRLSIFYYISSANIFNNNYTKQNVAYPCGYVFLVKDGAYKFSPTDLDSLGSKMFPVVVDWAVGNHTCQDAEKIGSSYACKSNHSECHNAEAGPGYHCKCISGFRGNPYLPNGCRDVDECTEESHNCLKGISRCINTPVGSYSCFCLKGYEGDGKNNGTGCHPKLNSNRIIIITLRFCGELMNGFSGYIGFTGIVHVEIVVVIKCCVGCYGGYFLLSLNSDNVVSLVLLIRVPQIPVKNFLRYSPLRAFLSMQPISSIFLFRSYFNSSQLLLFSYVSAMFNSGIQS
ncbi:Wall-associated receptor kinase 2 [Spatholobus suberectus]|nr:Wall-associated receptor kinase 2 [Spatholobus suberectus]